MLIGSFFSKTGQMMIYEEQKLCFDKLCAIINQCPRLSSEAHLFVIPGMSDPTSDNIFPQYQLPEVFFSSLTS